MTYTERKSALAPLFVRMCEDTPRVEIFVSEARLLLRERRLLYVELQFTPVSAFAAGAAGSCA